MRVWSSEVHRVMRVQSSEGLVTVVTYVQLTKLYHKAGLNLSQQLGS